MRIAALLATIMLAVVSLGVSNNTSITSAREFATPIAFAGSAQGATRFSSAHTALTKCGSGMTKKEEKEAEEHGSDIPTRCKGRGGYDVFIYYTACSSNFSLEKGEESISLGIQELNWKQKTVEWRMANAKPFAIIMRVYDFAGNEECVTGGKITGESLLIRGLKGYEDIDERVKVKGTPNPNLKARELADKAFQNRGR